VLSLSPVNSLFKFEPHPHLATFPSPSLVPMPESFATEESSLALLPLLLRLQKPDFDLLPVARRLEARRKRASPAP
jgi:hypothetical protein